jgi:segregation and condensation protein B
MMARMADDPTSPESASPAQSRFSLDGLSAAFARLTGAAPPDAEDTAEPPTESSADEAVTPRMIVEGMLFVGRADGRPMTSRELAAHIRDVSPQEVEALVDQLNELYRESGSSYEIVSHAAGFAMQLRTEYDPVRQRFAGKVREAKLSLSAIEVLSVVAYRQPVSSEEVGRLRGKTSQSLLGQLVRRGLLALERPDESPRTPVYHTTERFNRLFGIATLEDLPSSEDLDDN